MRKAFIGVTVYAIVMAILILAITCNSGCSNNPVGHYSEPKVTVIPQDEYIPESITDKDTIYGPDYTVDSINYGTGFIPPVFRCFEWSDSANTFIEVPCP